MNVLSKIADYWLNWDGEDENVTGIKLSTEDLRFICRLNTDKYSAQYKNKYFEWHFLNVDSSDYPQYDDSCLVCYYNNNSEQYEYELAWHIKHTTSWENEKGIIENVVAWKYLERIDFSNKR